MSNNFVGEIRIFGFSFPPYNWAFCDGQIVPIVQNTALFSIIGTYFGGNGTTTFALPNFQGRSGIHQGTGPGLSNYVVGEASGTPTVTLSAGQLPLHNHTINTRGNATNSQAARIPNSNAFLANSFPDNLYNDQAPSLNTSLAMSEISVAGGSVPHENMQPYLTVNYSICLYGIFPSRN